MAATAVQSFYRYHAYVYDWTRWTILHGRKRAVERMRIKPADTVLEVGCGTGLNFRYMIDRLDPDRGRLVGLDFSAHMLKQAEKRVAARGWKNVELLQADASNFTSDEQYDAIFFAYSLTMIPDWPAALERARDHVKPGGCVCVLDFGPFRQWGPLGPLMRGWLRLNHVETLRPYVQTMREVFGDVDCSLWLGGYNFTALARQAN